MATENSESNNFAHPKIEESEHKSKLLAGTFEPPNTVNERTNESSILLASAGSNGIFGRRRTREVNPPVLNNTAIVEQPLIAQKQPTNLVFVTALSDRKTTLYDYGNGVKLFQRLDGSKITVTPDVNDKSITIEQYYDSNNSLTSYRALYKTGAVFERVFTAYGKEERSFNSNKKLVKTEWFDKKDNKLATAIPDSKGNTLQTFPNGFSREIHPDGSRIERISDGQGNHKERAFDAHGKEIISTEARELAEAKVKDLADAHARDLAAKTAAEANLNISPGVKESIKHIEPTIKAKDN